MQYGDGGDAGSAECCQVAKDCPGPGPALDLIFHQIGPGALDQMNERQFMALRHVLNVHHSRKAHLAHGPGLDAAVIHPDHAARTGDEADPDDER